MGEDNSIHPIPHWRNQFHTTMSPPAKSWVSYHRQSRAHTVR